MRSERCVKADAHANASGALLKLLKVLSHFAVLSLNCKYLRIENILKYLNFEDVEIVIQLFRIIERFIDNSNIRCIQFF